MQMLKTAKRIFMGAKRRVVKVQKHLTDTVGITDDIQKVFFPSDNLPLTSAEFEHCCSLIDHYIEEGKQITAYCKAHNRNPEIYDRGNCWLEGWVDGAVNMLLSKKYNNVNRLRLIAFHFSAWRAFDISWGTIPATNDFFRTFYSAGMPELPQNVDSIIKSTVANPKNALRPLLPRLNSFINNVDNKYLYGQPLRFGEVAGQYRGFMINGDTQRYWGTMVVLYRTKILEHIESKIKENGFCRIIEIGAGYGGLGYQLKKTYSDKLQFIAVDLVESLIFSGCYLTTVLDEKPLYYKDEKIIPREKGLVFVPSFRSPEFFEAINNIDLCINTASMNEMSSAQVDYYGAQISKVLSPDGIFFECNWEASVAGAGRVQVKPILTPYFEYRLNVDNTEIACDGNLDIWSNSLPQEIKKACHEAYGSSEAVRKQAA